MTGRVIVINPCGKTGEVVADSLRRHGLDVTLLTGPSARKDEPGFLRELHKEVDKGDVAAIIPQPRFFTSPDEIETYPVVFKRPLGQGGDSVYFPKNRRALENLLKTESHPVVQEYIEGENVCVDTLRCPDGGFYAAAYRVLEPKGKGVSTLRAPADEPELSAICGKMLEHIDYYGICGFDFRRSITGETYFLEANPRFSGGLETTLASGLDLPWLLLHTQRF